MGLQCAGSDFQLQADMSFGEAPEKLGARNQSRRDYYSRDAGELNLAIERPPPRWGRAPFAPEWASWNPWPEKESGSCLQNEPEHASDSGQSRCQGLLRSQQTAPVCSGKRSDPTSQGIGQKVAQARVPAGNDELQELNAERKRGSGTNDSPYWKPHEPQADGQGNKEKDVVDNVHAAIFAAHQTPKLCSFRSPSLAGLGNEGGSQDDQQASAGEKLSPASLHMTRRARISGAAKG